MEHDPIILTQIPFTPTMELVAEGKMYRGDLKSPALTRLLERCAAAARPKAMAACLDVTHDEAGRVTAIGGEAMGSVVLDGQLQSLHRVFAYVCTCGVEMAGVDYEGSEELRRALLSICIGGMQAAMQALEAALQRQFRLGKTAVLNPGSLPEWPISEQPKLFRLLGDPEAAIGVTLGKNHFMQPLATSSGLLFETDHDYQNCTYCTNLNCIIRRAPYEPEKAMALRGS